MTTELVLRDTSRHIRVLTLNRPAALNAWTHAMQRVLLREVEAANDDPQIDAIVVTGAGDAFCAGADLSAVFGMTAAEKHQARLDARVIDWLPTVRKSKALIAAINGPAIGVGVSLVMGFDRIVSAETAYFDFAFTRIGIVPEFGATHFLERRVGFRRTTEWLLTAARVSAKQAFDAGLVDEIAPAERLLECSVAAAAALGVHSLAAVRATKELITTNGVDADLARVQRREIEALERCYASPEHGEAIAALKAKRQPDLRSVRR